MEYTLHTGKFISNYIENKSISKAGLARALNISPQTVEYRVKTATIPTDFLLKMCHALNHNFFADIAQMLPETYSTSTEVIDVKAIEIANLKQEINMLNREKELLASLLKGNLD
jgi:DNA-binding Xre family transcriptional regulator